MKSLDVLSLAALHVCLLLPRAAGHRQFMSFVPNGNKVPCDVNELSVEEQLKSCSGTGICAVFGHERCEAAGAITDFGKLVGRAVWNLDVCSLDSDLDGYTNGDELGDPCCRWGGGLPDRSSPAHISNPDYASSTPPFLSCAHAPSGANVSLLGVYADSPSATSQNKLIALLRLPPANEPATECICGLSMSTSNTSLYGTEVPVPQFSNSDRFVQVLIESGAVVGPGSHIGGKIRLRTLHKNSTLLNFNTTIQPLKDMPLEAVPMTLLSVLSSAPGSAYVDGEVISVNQPMLLPMGLVLIATVFSVAFLYYCPCLPSKLAVFCFNLKPTCCTMQVNRPTSCGFDIWRCAVLLMIVLSTAASIRAYSSMFYINMADAVFGRALGNSSLALLFGSLCSASHHMILHWAGVSYDRSIFGHTALGSAAIATLLVHGLWMVFTAGLEGVRVSQSLDAGGNGIAWALGHWCTVCSVNPLAGTLAGLSAIVFILLPSRLCLRRAAYGLFYVLHLLGAALVFLFTILHLRHSGVELNFTIIFPLVVLVVERMLVAVVHGATSSGKVLMARPVGKSDHPSGSAASVVYLQISQKCSQVSPAPGQWLSLVIPSISLMHHPFSVAGVTKKNGERILHFFIRVASQPIHQQGAWGHTALACVSGLCRAGTPWSARLLARASAGSILDSSVLLFDLPSGRHSQPQSISSSSKEHVFVAGGVGITAVLEATASQLGQGSSCTLVWAVREASLAVEAMELFQLLIAKHMHPTKQRSACKKVSDVPVSPDEAQELGKCNQASADAPQNDIQFDQVRKHGILRIYLYVSEAKAAAPSALPSPPAQRVQQDQAAEFRTENPVIMRGAAAISNRAHLEPLERVLSNLHAKCQGFGLGLPASSFILHVKPDVRSLIKQAALRMDSHNEGSACCYVCGPQSLSRDVIAAVDEVNSPATGGRQGRVLLHVEQFGW